MHSLCNTDVSVSTEWSLAGEGLTWPESMAVPKAMSLTRESGYTITITIAASQDVLAGLTFSLSPVNPA
jgi:hypothetical protein